MRTIAGREIIDPIASDKKRTNLPGGMKVSQAVADHDHLVRGNILGGHDLTQHIRLAARRAENPLEVRGQSAILDDRLQFRLRRRGDQVHRHLAVEVVQELRRPGHERALGDPGARVPAEALGDPLAVPVGVR